MRGSCTLSILQRIPKASVKDKINMEEDAIDRVYKKRLI